MNRLTAVSSRFANVNEKTVPPPLTVGLCESMTSANYARPKPILTVLSGEATPLYCNFPLQVRFAIGQACSARVCRHINKAALVHQRAKRDDFPSVVKDDVIDLNG